MSSIRHILRAALWVTLGAAIGCSGDQASKPTAPTSSATATAIATATATATAVKTPIDLPKEGDPANHHLEKDIVFAATSAYVSNTVYADPAKLLAEPSGPEAKAKLWSFVAKKEIERQHFWRTHRARPEEIAVGKVALMPHRKGSEGQYIAPTSVKEAYTARWWMARIISTRSKDNGYILVAGNYRIAPDAIRLLDGDDSPALTKQGAEDEHFIGEEHWFVSHAAIPAKGIAYIYPGMPLKPEQPFEGGEGRFLQLPGGKILLTAHAWQTRRATKADWKKGQRVIVPEIKEGGKYRAPKTRAEALTVRWWSVPIESVKGDMLEVKGGYQVVAAATRVIAEKK